MISSMAILDGTWEFYRHDSFVGPLARLGVGDYANLPDVGIPHDQVSSVRLMASS